MNKKFPAVLLILCGFAVSLNAQTALQRMYLTFLQSEGYTAEVDQDGDISFKAAGKTYFIIIDAKDTQFFQLMYGINIPDEDKPRVPEAVNYINRIKKVVKAYVDREGDPILTVEAFLKDPQDFAAVFPRMMEALDNARNELVGRLDE
ncbi:MAG: YbjN domain-containing protein [Treponema sp.]|jgi:hypothetical protein|nr:YbjN domain-containing protein [Treponema sp.]